MRLFIIIICVTLLTACATPQTTTQEVDWLPDDYYNEARRAQTSGDYAGAIRNFSAIEVHYPLSPYAQLAPIEIAYSRYKLQQYNSAVIDIDRFLAAYPDHPNQDYALYLKGLVLTAQGLIENDETGGEQIIRDGGKAREAFNQFALLAKRFPDSQYRAGALQQMSRVRNALARHELQAVKARLAGGDSEGAIRHAKYISEQYPKTPAAVEALDLITGLAYTPMTPLPVAQEQFPAATPEQPRITTAAKSGKYRREAWLLQQNPANFTLQIVGTSSQTNLERYIEQHNLQETSAYYQRNFTDKSWYTLLYGSFNSRSEAAETARRLKAELKIDNIWIRQFSDVHAHINPTAE